MPKPKIIYRKLGKEPPRLRKCTCSASTGTDFGRWHGKLSFKPVGGTIFLDPRQPPKEMLNTLTHELLHDSFPQLDEHAVTYIANHIADALWAQGYRKETK